MHSFRLTQKTPHCTLQSLCKNEHFTLSQFESDASRAHIFCVCTLTVGACYRQRASEPAVHAAYTVARGRREKINSNPNCPPPLWTAAADGCLGSYFGHEPAPSGTHVRPHVTIMIRGTFRPRTLGTLDPLSLPSPFSAHRACFADHQSKP